MTAYLRLRQICLVAADLQPAVAEFVAIFGVEPCYRDPNVAKYGLENALFAIGRNILEIVAPTEPGTAAGRFLARSGGHGGYMVILDCDDPEQRERHTAAIGVRTANRIDHGDYLGIQLHPRDCRAAMIEFNTTKGGADLDGPYNPAGPDWPHPSAISDAMTLLDAEIESPQPADIGTHWASILDRNLDGDRIVLDLGSIRFIPGTTECLAGIRLAVPNPDAICAAAAARGHIVQGGGFQFCGVRIGLIKA
jgi:hypothetical protein